MIRGYVAIVAKNSPLPDTFPNTALYRKAAVKLGVSTDCGQKAQNSFEFYIGVVGTDYFFKVVGNVRTVDKRSIASGVARFGFTAPNLDLVIHGDPRGLQMFARSVEVVNCLKALPPPKCHDKTHAKKLKCICQSRKFSQFQRCHISNYACPVAVPSDEMCAFCCYRVLKCYSCDDAFKIINSWKPKLWTADLQLGIHSITVASYVYLSRIDARQSNLVEIPEAIGSLPFLSFINLSGNRLGQAMNWNWLTSPFIRESLRELWLGFNKLLRFPDAVLELKNLEVLSLNGNYLSELPAGMGNLKCLRCLLIQNNKLRILPGQMYRKECFSELYVCGNDFAVSTEYHRGPQLNPKDFETVAVPSLFETVAKIIITERFAFWEYNIPAKLAEYLEGAYCCRCGSVVFPDTTGHVVHCRIETRALAQYYIVYGSDSVDDYDYVVPIAIRYCSYQCYKSNPDVIAVVLLNTDQEVVVDKDCKRCPGTQFIITPSLLYGVFDTYMMNF